MTTHLRRRTCPLLLLLAAGACDSLTGPDDAIAIPLQEQDGWETASLESVGLDPDPFRALLTLIDRTQDHFIHGILVVRNDRLVFEEYWPGVDMEDIGLNPVQRPFGYNTLHYVASVSKSITSALVGIALDRGLLGSVDDPLFWYFPEYGELKTVENEAVTLRHLLSFSSGFDWNEHVYGFDDPRDSHFQMFATEDPVRMLLSRPMVRAPGAAFHYNSGDTNLLGEIVRRESGAETLVAFAHEVLFGPLQIESYTWGRFPLAPEVTFASGGAFLRPRDMAKLGALYLNGGVWNGQRVVPEAWVQASVIESMHFQGSYGSVTGYGFNWWLGRSAFRDTAVEYFRASGWGGQEVFAFPELALVVVFTAGGYHDDPALDVDDLIEDFILQAVRD
jgi:CubicO group peptidase (beta-lactamase class C family)